MTYSFVKSQARVFQNENSLNYPAVTVCGSESPLNGTMVRCKFNGLDCNNITDIVETKIWKPDLTRSFRCFTFTRNTNLIPENLKENHTNIGPSSGLEIGFLTNMKENLFMFIQDAALKPGIFRTSFEGQEYELDMKHLNRFVVELVNEENLGDPYSKCVQNLRSTNSYNSSVFRLGLNFLCCLNCNFWI